ncbi:MAG: MFS transporter [Candidatus Limnocylindria bacterium]
MTVVRDAGLGHVLRSPRFGYFWLAQAISRFGDPITIIALAAASYRLTGSALFTSLAVLIATVPQATFGFFAGAIADAVGHRRAMVVCDLLRAFVIALIPIALALGAPLAVPYGLVLVAALCSATFNTARLAIVPALVPGERLAASNSFIFATDRSVEIAGALAAGVLVATIGDAAFWLDALTFAVSAALLARIALEEPAPRSVSWRSMSRDALAGLRFLRSSEVLFSYTVFSLVAQLSIPVLNGLLPVLLFRHFAGGDIALGAQQFGLAEAALAAGAVGAGLVLSPVLDRVRKGRLVVAGFALFGAALVLVAFTTAFELLVVLMVLIGVTNVLFYAPNVAIAQEQTPPGLRARVFGARAALLNLTWLPFVLVGGALGDVVAVPLLIGAAGVLTLGAAAVALATRALPDVR